MEILDFTPAKNWKETEYKTYVPKECIDGFGWVKGHIHKAPTNREHDAVAQKGDNLILVTKAWGGINHAFVRTNNREGDIEIVDCWSCWKQAKPLKDAYKINCVLHNELAAFANGQALKATTKVVFVQENERLGHLFGRKQLPIDWRNAKNTSNVNAPTSIVYSKYGTIIRDCCWGSINSEGVISITAIKSGTSLTFGVN